LYPQAHLSGVADGSEDNWTFLRRYTQDECIDFLDVIGNKEFVIFSTAACDSVLEGCAIHKPLPSPNRRLLLLCSARHLSQCGSVSPPKVHAPL
jgi:hypothetical protein